MLAEVINVYKVKHKAKKSVGFGTIGKCIVKLLNLGDPTQWLHLSRHIAVQSMESAIR